MTSTTTSAADPLQTALDAALAAIKPAFDAHSAERESIMADIATNDEQAAAVALLNKEVARRRAELDARLATLDGTIAAPAKDTTKEPDKDEAENPDAKKTAKNAEAEKPDANTADSEADEKKPDTAATKDAKKDETSKDKKTEPEPQGIGKVWAWFGKYAGGIVGGLIAVSILILLWTFVSWLGTSAVAGLMGLFVVLTVIVSIILLILGPYVGSRRQHAVAKAKAHHNDLGGTED